MTRCLAAGGEQVLRQFASGSEAEAERLDYFISAEGRDDLYAYNQREGGPWGSAPPAGVASLPSWAADGWAHGHLLLLGRGLLGGRCVEEQLAVPCLPARAAAAEACRAMLRSSPL